MKTIPEPMFTPVAETIKVNREDERKTLMNGFASRLRSVAYKALSKKMTPAEIYHLLNGEAERVENEAGELNHV